MKYKKAIILSAIIAIALIAVVGVRYMSYNNTKKEMLNYLKDKYGVEFEEAFYEKGATFFKELYGDDKMVVRSKENKELYCTVFVNTGRKGYVDNYGTAVQSLKFTELNYDKIQNLDNRKKTFRFSIETSANIQNKDGINYDVLKLIKEQSAHNLHITLYLGIVCDSEPDKEKESKILYELYKYVQEFEKENDKDFIVTVAYIKPSVFEKAQLFTSTIPVYIAGWDDLGKNNIYYKVRFDQEDKIDSPNYFLDKFKRVEE